MSRYIDADSASLNLEINFTEEEKAQKKLSIIDLITYIGEQPTVDAVPVGRCDECKKILLDKNVTATFPIADYVPVVRCKDCKWWGAERFCENSYSPCFMDCCTLGNWFCADGEKKVSE